MIVSHACGQADEAAGALAVFGGVAAALNVNGAKSIDAHPHLEGAGPGVGDVEPVQAIDNLSRAGAVHVELAGRVLQDSRKQRQGVADVPRHRVRKVDDFGAGQFFTGGCLRGVDGRGRVNHVDGLAELLLMVQSDFRALGFSGVDALLNDFIEAYFGHAELITAGSEAGKLAAAREVRLVSEDGLPSGRCQRDLGR